ncbi:MAG: transcription antitermination factor NusB [Clostridia bacterium]|nr:transcription antitermination factor NusB [Clostridia bacterium]
MTRKEARDITFILIFEKLFSDSSPDEILQLASEVRDIEPDDYVTDVFKGVCEKEEELTSIISQKAIGWSISRISKTSLAVLKLAIYEIKYMDSIPNSVSINEAVELCKKYATQDDASFVNGILASVVKG